MKFLLPLILLLVGTGGGVGAAMFLAPPAADLEADAGCVCEQPVEIADSAPDEVAPDDPDSPPEGSEYARLSNQFIVPVVQQERVAALVVLSLSVEVVAGQKNTVFEQEPRLRDAFLQVMFDHANQGGFDGVFTATEPMGNLRAALRTVARDAVGTDVIDVLILDLVRQEVPG